MANYVDNRKFLESLIEYRKSKELNPDAPIPRYVSKAFIDIANGMSKRSNFRSYPFVEEMVGDAIVNCVEAVDSFDPEKSSNPFGYFSLVVWRRFIYRIRQEKRALYIKEKNTERANVFGEVAAGVGGTAEHFSGLQIQRSEGAEEYMSDFVRKYEEKIGTRKPTKESTREGALSKFM